METEAQHSVPDAPSPEGRASEPDAPAAAPGEGAPAAPRDAPASATPPGVAAGARPSRAPLVALVLALAVPGATSGLWLSPRPAPPAEMPPLVVPQRQADASIARIAALAARAPADDDTTEARRRELYLAHGLAEVRPNAAPGAARLRDQELLDLAAALEQAGTLEAIRARDVVRMVDALGRAGDDETRVGEVGGFPRSLAQWGAVHAGRRIAPRVVVYALAWARWNGIHHRPLTEAMDDTMLLAYHGWLVFYGSVGGTDLREDALVSYVSAGGRRGLESEGFLRLSLGDPAGAQLAFEAAYEETGNVRLRNHALAVGLSSLEVDEARPGDGGG